MVVIVYAVSHSPMYYQLSIGLYGQDMVRHFSISKIFLPRGVSLIYQTVTTIDSQSPSCTKAHQNCFYMLVTHR